MTKNRGPDKTLHVSVKNRNRLSAFGDHGDSWNEVIGKVLDIAENVQREPDALPKLNSATVPAAWRFGGGNISH